MADSTGKSAPANPAIGLGNAQAVVIGVKTVDLPTVIAGPPAWGASSLGNFIGQQSKAAPAPYSQAQGDTPADFDASFVTLATDGAGAVKAAKYTRESANQYDFVLSTPAPVATSFTVQNGANAAFATGTTVKATVLDQLGRPMSGISVTVVSTGGTATTPAVAGSPATTDASGVATVTVTAAAAGTVTGTVTPAGLTAKVFSITLT
jgi:Bacterial Ig-like domain (group 1)